MTAAGTARYDAEYGRSADELYAVIRREGYGEDIGQFSWLTADEYRRWFNRLGIDGSCHVLEIASGTGGPAVFMAEETGCRVTGVELHAAGVAAAQERAAQRGVADRAAFVRADAREPLPFETGSFDALACIDAVNHLYERERVFAEWHRVLAPGARVLFTDPTTVTGPLRREEIIARSIAMGEFVFTPPGVNETLLREAGFVDVSSEDATENMATCPPLVAAARARFADELIAAEGAEDYAAYQRLLETIGTLAREGRLSRILHVATKPASGREQHGPGRA